MSVLKMTGARILVKRDPKELSRGGIILPDQAAQKPSTGVVLDVGPGIFMEKLGRHMPVHVKAGDRILFAPLQGTEVSPDLAGGEQDLFITNEAHVLAVMSHATDAPTTQEEAFERIEFARGVIKDLEQSLEAAGIEVDDLTMLTGKRGILDEIREAAANTLGGGN